MIKNILECISKLVTSFFVMFIILYCAFVGLTSVKFHSTLFELCFYLGTFCALLYLVYGLFKNFKKRQYFIILILYLLFVYLIPKTHIYNQYDCISDSICKEGLEINTEYGLIKVNKENCLKYGWIWDDKKKICNMKDE